MPSVYVAEVIAAGDLHFQTKHQITLQDVVDAVQWPASARIAFDDDEEHGPRWIAVGTDSNQRTLYIVLRPVPLVFEELAETWEVVTAYPV